MNYSDSIKAILLAAINDLSKTPEKYVIVKVQNKMLLSRLLQIKRTIQY